MEERKKQYDQHITNGMKSYTKEANREASARRVQTQSKSVHQLNNALVSFDNFDKRGDQFKNTVDPDALRRLRLFMQLELKDKLEVKIRINRLLGALYPIYGNDAIWEEEKRVLGSNVNVPYTGIFKSTPSTRLLPTSGTPRSTPYS